MGAPTVRDQVTIDRYDYAGRKVAEINANGDTAYWTYTANGKVATHTDLGGQISTYTYDAYAGYLVGIKSRRPDTTAGAPAGSMVDARDVRYEYDTAGQLRRIVDAGANQITEYAYDAMGRHVRESLTQGGTVIRDTRIGYDALGRMTKVSDPGQYTRYTFDANGNRRRGLTQYVDNGGVTRMVDNWTTYDRENRITLTQGELVDLKNAQGVVTGQQIQITARQGQQLAYDTHGNRRSATGMAGSGYAGSAVTEFYTYDDDNRLIGTYKNGLMAAGRAYDGAGRMTDYITYTTSGAIDSRRENLYFDNGWMKQQNLYGGGGGLNQRTDYSAANAYDKVGNLLNYNVGVYVGTSYTNYYTYTYTKFDDYKEVKVAGSSTYLLAGETNTAYDVNGHISTVLDGQQQWVADGEYGYYAQQTTRTRSFIGQLHDGRRRYLARHRRQGLWRRRAPADACVQVSAAARSLASCADQPLRSRLVLGEGRAQRPGGRGLQVTGPHHLHIRPMPQHVHHQFPVVVVRHFQHIAAVLLELALLLRMPHLARHPARALGREAQFRNLVGLAAKNAVARLEVFLQVLFRHRLGLVSQHVRLADRVD